MRLAVSPDALRAAGQRLSTGATSLRELIGVAAASYQALDWQSRQRANLDTAVQGLGRRAAALASELDSLGRALASGATRFEEADRDGAAAIGAGANAVRGRMGDRMQDGVGKFFSFPRSQVNGLMAVAGAGGLAALLPPGLRTRGGEADRTLRGVMMPGGGVAPLTDRRSTPSGSRPAAVQRPYRLSDLGQAPSPVKPPLVGSIRGDVNRFQRDVNERRAERRPEFGLSGSVTRAYVYSSASGRTHVAGVSASGGASHSEMAGTLGGGFGRDAKGRYQAGVSADVYVNRDEAHGRLGSKQLGLTGSASEDVLGANAEAGYEHGSVGASAGVDVISVSGHAGTNLGGVNMGAHATVGLKAEVGFSFGEKTEVKLPFVTLGIDIGGAL